VFTRVTRRFWTSGSNIWNSKTFKVVICPLEFEGVILKKFLGSLTMLAVMFLLLAVPVFAQGNETDIIPLNGENGFEEIKILGETLVSFVLAAVLWALTGFFKIRDPETEVFDPVQFCTTLVVGAITGIIAFVIYEVKGVSLAPTEIWEYLIAAGFVAFVESWIKVVWRRIKPYFTPPT